MWQLAAAMIEIALRRRGPESLPDSTFLVLFLLVLDAALDVVASLLIGDITGLGFLRFAASTSLIFAFVFAVLSFFKLERRYRQTMSALLGAFIVIGIAFLPIAVVGVAMGLKLEEPPFLWFGLVFELWAIFIAASVLARSLSQPFVVGLMFAILLVVTLESLSNLLAPAIPPVSMEAS